jgi:hypothetical protein
MKGHRSISFFEARHTGDRAGELQWIYSKTVSVENLESAGKERDRISGWRCLSRKARQRERLRRL